MTWWQQTTPDWSSGDPKRVLELLSHAYDERSAIDALARRLGIDLRQGPPALAEPEETWRWVLDRAAEGRSLFVLMLLVLTDPSVEMFHLLLSKLIGDSGLEGIAEGGGLQGIMDPRRGLADPREVVQVCVDAQRRTALIEVDGIPRGTGFLVGPDLLMTAAHVIGVGWPPDPKNVVTAVFDRYAGAVAPAEDGMPVSVVEWVAGSPPTSSEIEGRYHAWDAPTCELDYAIGRLARAVGADAVSGDRMRQPRGSYVVSDSAYKFEVAVELTILQHPLGGPQQRSTTWGSITPNDGVTRIRYKTNTLPGSSGSACIDGRGRLVAMHHFAAPHLNQGVPISAIAKDLRDVKQLRLPLGVSSKAPRADSPSLDPFATLQFGRKPFINRRNLRERIELMFGRNGRVLVIEGRSRVGKSYSFQLLSHLAWERDCPRLRELAPRGVQAHKLDLDEYINVPTEGLRQKLIDAILLRLGVVAPREDLLAQSARTFATLSAWLPTQLRKDGALHWMFIDNLDRFALERDGVKELLAALASMLDDDPTIPLRLVLVVGEKGSQLPELATRWVERDIVTSLGREEAAQWLEDSLEARGAVAASDGIRAKVEAIYQPTIPSAESLAIAVATALEDLTKGAD